MSSNIYILGIESSCDDTSVAVSRNAHILSNVTASQQVHQQWGGVVPELASRAHQQNIVPVMHQALQLANITPKQLNAIAFTRGPGLMGSLLVGGSFARGMALSLNIPLIGVNHMEAHVLAHMIEQENKPVPSFPFICLTVSGGHTQIVQVHSPTHMEILGETTDDAVGEAFDKAAKVMGLPYPGGPVIDTLAQKGNPQAFTFGKPRIPNLDYSFSGLKTSFLYLIQKNAKENPNFIEERKEDLAASYQKTLIDVLLDKLRLALLQTGIKNVAVAGGVSANSGLRSALLSLGKTMNVNVFLPDFQYTTDNGAMIAVAGYYQYLHTQNKKFATEITARLPIKKMIHKSTP